MAKAIETLSIKLDFKAGSGSQQIIDKIGKSIKDLKVTAGQTAPSIEKVRKSINDFAKQGNRSISTIEGQVTALRALRREADINSKEFKELTADIGRYEKQLTKAQGRKGGGARQATQVAGAVISGGIFGGPEGAVGALAGASLGGVQGAFAGAAIGAQLKGIRDLTSGAADYASRVQKLEIALEGVAGGTENYNSALETARQVTADLNVPALDSVRGITRLTAAVSGAGGPVGDAETTFKNVTAAIKATGGSTEDVKGAITAMVQVFSKGKVSAEELSGQLGERLPGAVTLFAKANKMTLPELQKNLKAGTVGLNELMNFIVELGDTYSGTASKIANSNAEAGARLAVAVQDMQAQVGAALVPIGAQFQNAFTVFIKEITPFLTTNVPKIAKLFLSLSKNLDTLVVAAATAFAVFAAAKIAAIVTSLGGIKTALILIKEQLIATALANPFTALAVGAGILAGAIFNASKRQKELNDLLKKGSVAEVTASLRKVEKERDEAIERLVEAKKKVPKRNEGETGIAPAGFDRGVEVAQNEVNQLNQKVDRLRTKLNQIRDTDPTQGAAEGYLTGPFERFDYGSPTAEKDSGKDGGTDTTQARIGRADEIVRKLRDQLNIQKAKSKVGEFLAKQAKERSDLEARFQALLKDGSEQKIVDAHTDAKKLLAQKQAFELEKRTKEVMEKATKPLEDMNKKLQEKIRHDKEYKRLIAEGVNPELAKQLIEINKLFEAGDKKLQQRILDLEAQKAITGLSKKELQNINDQIEAIEKRRAALKGDKKDAEGSADEAYADPSFMDGLRKGLNDLYNEATNLNELIANVGVNAVNSFADAFVDLALTGKASFAELTASILRDLARIIMKAAILQAVKAFIPGLFANGGVTQGASGYTPIPGSVTEVAANGLAVAKNGIVPYAKGGLVTKPTLFQYKQGGVGSYGLMGEAGTEAIMPLRRGANGKLGVEASGSGVGSVVVNVDAAGSSVEGDGNQAAQLGKAIGIAVQQELVKQKRPGGLLSR